MNYTVSLLATAADCQALIDIANAEKDSLQYRKTGLIRDRQSVSLTSAGIETALASVTAELNALQTVINSLPDGAIKQETAVKIRKVEYKKFLLEQRRENYGVLVILEKEYDISCTEKNMEETDLFIQALTTRMNSL